MSNLTAGHISNSPLHQTIVPPLPFIILTLIRLFSWTVMSMVPNGHRNKKVWNIDVKATFISRDGSTSLGTCWLDKLHTARALWTGQSFVDGQRSRQSEWTRAFCLVAFIVERHRSTHTEHIHRTELPNCLWRSSGEFLAQFLCFYKK